MQNFYFCELERTATGRAAEAPGQQARRTSRGPGCSRGTSGNRRRVIRCRDGDGALAAGGAVGAAPEISAAFAGEGETPKGRVRPAVDAAA